MRNLRLTVLALLTIVLVTITFTSCTSRSGQRKIDRETKVSEYQITKENISNGAYIVDEHYKITTVYVDAILDEDKDIIYCLYYNGVDTDIFELHSQIENRVNPMKFLKQSLIATHNKRLAKIRSPFKF